MGDLYAARIFYVIWRTPHSFCTQIFIIFHFLRCQLSNWSNSFRKACRIILALTYLNITSKGDSRVKWATSLTWYLLLVAAPTSCLITALRSSASWLFLCPTYLPHCSALSGLLVTLVRLLQPSVAACSRFFCPFFCSIGPLALGCDDFRLELSSGFGCYCLGLLIIQSWMFQTWV